MARAPGGRESLSRAGNSEGAEHTHQPPEVNERRFRAPATDDRDRFAEGKGIYRQLAG
jgi:hypothetical protein